MNHSLQHVVKSVGIFLCLFLASCEGSPLGDSLEKNLEPDPRLLEEETNEIAQPAEPVPKPLNIPNPAEIDSELPNEASNESTLTETSAAAITPTFTQASYTDIGEAPEELQQYIEDLVALDLLLLIDVNAEDDVERNPNEFLPNEIITRREYARWLLSVNNYFYNDQPSKKIRLAVEGAQPAFQDVGKTNIDFASIQGLAEAGIIHSSLNGSTTVLKFRPNAPLTRKELILWKVPLDTRTVLPTATAEAVTEAWGFQDAGKIEPIALKAVLADHNNGEFANIRRTLGYTTLFQPDKGVTRAEAAAVLWRFGNSTEGIRATDLLIENENKSTDKPADQDQEKAE